MRGLPIIPVSFDPCPACKGLARAPNTGVVGFEVVLDPEYLHIAPDRTWHKEFYVCAACLGTGKLADALARRLSGEWTPGAGHAAGSTTPKPKDQNSHS